MAAPGVDSNRGAVYLFFGRSTAAWIALAGGNPIPMSAADRTFLGPTPLAGGATTNDFGRLRGGYASIGSDFVIPASATAVSSLFIFRGADVADAGFGPTATTGTGGVANMALQTLTGTLGGILGVQEGFGARAVSNLDVVGSTGLDLIVSEPKSGAVPSGGRIHFYDNRQAGMFGPSFLTIRGPTSADLFGVDLQCVDFTGDGRRDLFVGDRSAGGAAYFLFNRGISGSEFESPGAAGSFWYSKLQGTQLGLGMAAGDFNGDGKIDVAIADDLDGRGKVHVWH